MLKRQKKSSLNLARICTMSRSVSNIECITKSSSHRDIRIACCSALRRCLDVMLEAAFTEAEDIALEIVDAVLVMVGFAAMDTVCEKRPPTGAESTARAKSSRSMEYRANDSVVPDMSTRSMR